MSDFMNPQSGAPVPPLALFLDFDGTLVDLAPTPDGITVPPDLISEIRSAREAFGGAVALVSGRAIADLDRHLPDRLAIAGGHGTERRAADGSLEGSSSEIGAAAVTIADQLAHFVESHEGLLMERKTAAVALHYRHAPELRDECLARLTEAATAVGFGIVDGKMVVEARPSTISKGSAVRAFMQEAPFKGRLPVFIGDDTTDEDGFAAAQELNGIGVKVGEGETVAKLRTPDVGSVRAIIRGLVDRYGAGATSPEAH